MSVRYIVLYFWAVSEHLDRYHVSLQYYQCLEETHFTGPKRLEKLPDTTALHMESARHER